jgi:xanthine dehydrogenase accessory factor
MATNHTHHFEHSDMLSEDIFARAADLRRRAVPFVLATVVWSKSPTSARPGAKGIVTSDGALFGWVGGSCAQPTVAREALNALSDGQSRLLRLDPDGTSDPARPSLVVAPLTCQSGGAMEVFLEPFLPALQLIVFGQSPVADALIRLGHVMGYRVVASRPGSTAAAPTEAALVLDRLDVDSCAAGRQTVAVVASMGVYDEDAIAAALHAGAGFVALVASRKRFERACELLAGSGITDEELQRVKGPAGLDIAAGTPEEIAVSILAEIIQQRSTLPIPSARVHAARTETAIDPVCGMEIEVATARYTADYQGTRYYFCCAGCCRAFESEPQRYLPVE